MASLGKNSLDSIYKEIESLIKLSKFEAIDYQHGERNKDYWEKAEQNINKIGIELVMNSILLKICYQFFLFI